MLSPIGIGFDDFTAAVAARRCGRVALDGFFNEPMPAPAACFMPAFTAGTFLGKKGTSTFDRLTALVVAACGLALEHSRLAVTDDNRTRVGIAIGTSTGSMKSSSDYTRESLVQERPYLVNPMLFPNTILNCAASQAAIRFSLKGVNATISGGQLSSLMALRYASTVIRQGYVDVLLVGAAEEFTPHSAWRCHHAGVLEGTNTLVGEGCAIFVVEDPATAEAAGRRPCARILACETATCGRLGRDPHVADGLARCIRRALQRAALAPERIWAISGCSTGEPLLDETERDAIGQALGAMPPVSINIKQQIGDCYSAAGAFQLAAILSAFRGAPADGPRCGLVTSISHGGAVGCAIVQQCA